MSNRKFFFIYLTILLIVLELSWMGFLVTALSFYLIPIIITTIGISSALYGLHQEGLKSKTIKPRTQYYFYYIDNTPVTQTYNQLNNRF